MHYCKSNSMLSCSIYKPRYMHKNCMLMSKVSNSSKTFHYFATLYDRPLSQQYFFKTRLFQKFYIAYQVLNLCSLNSSYPFVMSTPAFCKGSDHFKILVHLIL